MTDKTSIGDRMKMYEAPDTSRVVFKGLPLVARLDGKNFHTFTKGLRRPYDERLSTLMVDTAKILLERFGATIAYTQSDEITLVWYVPTNSQAEYPFAGRFQKINSLLGGFASAFFTKELMTGRIPEKQDYIAIFDCRSFGVPTLQEAYHAVLWRQQDATKNAISMAAQSMFPHKSLIGLNGSQMQEKMWKEKGVNFNEYPSYFKRGTFVRREKKEMILSQEQLDRIPVDKRPTEPVLRTIIEARDIWLTKQPDPVGVLFNGADIVAAPNPEIPSGTGYQDPFKMYERLGKIPMELDKS